MMRAVLDTNVLAAGVAHSMGQSGRLVTSWKRGRFELVTSEHILDELAMTLEKRYFKKNLTKRERKRIVATLRRRAVVIDEIVAVDGVAPSPEDDRVLAAAATAAAEYLVTGDQAFRVVSRFEEVRIVTPREFLALIEPDGRSRPLSISEALDAVYIYEEPGLAPGLAAAQVETLAQEHW